MEENVFGMMLGLTDEAQANQLRNEIHRMVDVVSLPYLDDLRWTVQQYAAKSLNEELEDRHKKVKN